MVTVKFGDTLHLTRKGQNCPFFHEDYIPPERFSNDTDDSELPDVFDNWEQESDPHSDQSSTYLRMTTPQFINNVEERTTVNFGTETSSNSNFGVIDLELSRQFGKQGIFSACDHSTKRKTKESEKKIDT